MRISPLRAPKHSSSSPLRAPKHSSFVKEDEPKKEDQDEEDETSHDREQDHLTPEIHGACKGEGWGRQGQVGRRGVGGRE